MIENLGNDGFVTICGFCGNRERVHHRFNGREICGKCLEKRTKKDTEMTKEIFKPMVEKTEEILADVLPNRHSVIDGIVYDITQRKLGSCKHTGAKNLEKLLSKKFNFCMDCGGYLRRKTLDNVKSSVKIKSASNRKSKKAKGSKDEIK